MKRRRQYHSLQQWLQRTGTPQYVLAEMVGMSNSALSMLLRGHRRCSVARALRLEEITGVPVRKLAQWPKFQPKSKTEQAA